MGTRPMQGSASALPDPLALALSAIPSLPRPLLSRLVARAIERLDELDGDPDFEDDTEDRCLAGDDGVFDGPAIISDHLGFSSRPSRYCLGVDEDCEAETLPERPVECGTLRLS